VENSLTVPAIGRFVFLDHQPKQRLDEARGLVEVFFKSPFHFAAEKRNGLLGILDAPERKIAVPSGTQLL
jgi:hypothetical protein